MGFEDEVWLEQLAEQEQEEKVTEYQLVYFNLRDLR